MRQKFREKEHQTVQRNIKFKSLKILSAEFGTMYKTAKATVRQAAKRITQFVKRLCQIKLTTTVTILSAISQNAIRITCDKMLRPEVYRQYEEYLKVLHADILTDVRNGRDLENARKAAYEQIYQSVNPSFNYDKQFLLDICYHNILSFFCCNQKRQQKRLFVRDTKNNFHCHTRYQKCNPQD